MIHAVVAKAIDGVMEPVGTIDIGKTGIVLDSSDKDLKKIIEEVNSTGIPVIDAGSSTGQEVGDEVELLVITEANHGALIPVLNNAGFQWWQEKDEEN